MRVPVSDTSCVSCSWSDTLFMAQLIAVLVLNHVGFCVSYVVA